MSEAQPVRATGEQISNSATAFRHAPTIETERLVLRHWRKDDFRPYHAILCQPEVHRHFGPNPATAEDCWRRLLAAGGRWQFNGFGTSGGGREAGGKVVGTVGVVPR